jgi:uncharacterized protein (TIGR03437 family)
MLRQFFSAALLCAIPAFAQLPSAASIKGIYNVRYLGVNTDPSDTAVGFSGTFTFDGNGGFTVTGQGTTAGGALKFQSSGQYTVYSSGSIAMSNPFDPITSNNTTLYGGLGATGVLFASSTDTFYCDVFVAIPAATNATNGTMKGSYRVASMEFLNGSFSASRDTFFSMTADGSGGLGNVSIVGTAQSLNGTATTQTSAGATYSLSGPGTGTMNFPAPNGVTAANTLLSGNKTLYAASDGSIFIAGSPTGYDFVIGIQNNSASATPLNGLYFTGYLQNFAPGTADGGIFAGEGAANELPSLSNLEIVHQRTNPDGFANYDQVYDDTFTFQSDGTATYSDAYYAAGGSGNFAIGAGAGNSNYMLVLYMKAPAMNGSGVFLNPQGVVNSANSAPFTAQYSPGEVITLFGTGIATSDATASAPFPTTLGGVQVLVSGTAAPIYSVCASCTPQQISAVIPYTVSNNPGDLMTFQVMKGGSPSNTVNGYTGATSPGIFTIPPGGISDGAIEHADGSVVTASNPAKAGETVAIFLTGLGAVTPTVAAGAPAPSNPLAKVVAPVSVFIGSGSSQMQATVAFAGLAPSLGGLYQVNVTIPAGLPAGDQVIEILTGVDFGNGPTIDVDNAEATIPIGK